MTKTNLMKKTISFLILIFLVTTNVIAQVFPDQNWSYNEASESDGWNSKKMEELNQYIIDSTKITGFLIIHKGQIVFEYGDIIENSYIASCRKSILAMLYGKYVENGQIKLNKTIEELEIDDVEGILPIEKKATIENLISARSGVYHPEGYPGGMQQFAPERGSVNPGEYWLYSNWDFNVAGFVFEQETGKNIYDEIESQLAKPLNMQDWDRSLQVKQGDITISKYLAYPMWFSTRDMARIGLLMLNKGKWNEQQIISEDWHKKMLKQRTTSTEINDNVPVFRNTGVNFGYGYMWWLFEKTEDLRLKNAFTAMGAMGQSITIYPEIDVVVAYKTKAAYRRVNSGQIRIDLLKKAVEIYKSE
jgi:CubicO group peptidase (beta-lactamase class C family)